MSSDLEKKMVEKFLEYRRFFENSTPKRKKVDKKRERKRKDKVKEGQEKEKENSEK